jgi:ATP-dependent exoDNAse (exonuclease V), alpha subunit - helicase superfamily I member
MGGLQKKLFLCVGARVMLLRNLWTDVGLCNGALGTIHSIVYTKRQRPPLFPIAIMIQFDDSYRGPSFLQEIPNLVPVPPCTAISEFLGHSYERTLFPIKLAWAITIHKSQGLEKARGLLGWVMLHFRGLIQWLTWHWLKLIESMSFERLTSISNKLNVWC